MLTELNRRMAGKAEAKRASRRRLKDGDGVTQKRAVNILIANGERGTISAVGAGAAASGAGSTTAATIRAAARTKGKARGELITTIATKAAPDAAPTGARTGALR